MTQLERESLVEYTLNIGRQMMECGAEAWRAENTMARILRAYELEVLDAHCLATQTAVTVKGKDGSHYTSTCMVLPDKTGTNLRRLEDINAAARYICDVVPPLKELPKAQDHSGPRWSWGELAGYLLGSGAFAVFFGGTVVDGLVSSAVGFVIYLMEQFRRVHRQHRTIYTLVACFLSGILARLVCGLDLGLNLDMIVIGDIMLFIPGLYLVNGVRELFYTDILTGIYRMTEAFLGAGAIAAGYAVAMMIGGGFL
ncbi:MAG: threonine/serine exporter family protein [Ruminiclostridium sp.]|nr:threonine/serine exporter family protein [Ruminiclostridium sp.]